jgi:3-methyl-2-oxobutanoate hydroxymethyltransferase
MTDRVTVPMVRARKGGSKIKMITAYDTPTARIADTAGADIILVGDSMANAVLGLETTLQVTVDMMAHHCAAVARARPRALVVADMPWLSYHISADEAVRNAGRFLRECGAGAVKLEGGRKRLPVVQALLEAEIPVMAHLGLTPQSVLPMGGYRVQGRELDDAQAMIQDAVALDGAGVFSIVLEGVPAPLGKLITEEVSVPTIGIGAGVGVDGQVMVIHDLLGLHDGPQPKFVRLYANLFADAVTAVEEWFADVEAGRYPSDEESYGMPAEVARELRSEVNRSRP